MDKNFDKTANTTNTYHADVNWRGFGTIPKDPMIDNRLTDTAKTIYSYFCAYGGDKKIAFPSRDRILRELNMSKTKFYSHFSLLKKYGYIKCHQEHRYGKYAHNTYVLVQIVPVSAEEYEEYTAVGKVQEIKKDSPMPQEEFAPSASTSASFEAPEASHEDWEAYFAYAELYADELIQNEDSFVSFDEQTEASASVGQSGTHAPSDPASFFPPQCPNSENQCPTTQESQCPSRKDTNINMGYNNHTLYSKYSPCQSMSMTEQTKKSEPFTVDIVDSYVDTIKKNIDYDSFYGIDLETWQSVKTADVSLIDEFIGIIVDTIITASPTVKINGEDKPRELVKHELLKLNYQNIAFALEQYKSVTTRIRNKRAYLLTLLYNSRFETEAAAVNQYASEPAFISPFAGNYC